MCDGAVDGMCDGAVDDGAVDGVTDDGTKVGEDDGTHGCISGGGVAGFFVGADGVRTDFGLIDGASDGLKDGANVGLSEGIGIGCAVGSSLGAIHSVVSDEFVRDSVMSCRVQQSESSTVSVDMYVHVVLYGTYLHNGSG